MKKHFFNIVSLTFFITGFTFFGYTQNVTIKGKVQGTEEVLEAATVSIDKITVLTDKNGEFSYSLKPGIYTIFITHAGYKKVVQEIKIEPGNTQIIDFIMTPNEQLGDVVLLGSRSLVQRSNLNTAVPVDVLSSGLLMQTGQPGLTQMLNFAAPSINASRQTLNESITLRGLSPDQVLILVNGTRYHNMAKVNDGVIRGELGKSSVSNDLNAIPFSAIEKIEILRDGASAQYGSDAIAGVINILLKKSTGKTSVNLHLGELYKGDGENISFGINHGNSLNKKGFLNFSGDFRYRNPTFRGGEYKGTVYINNPVVDDSIIQARNFNRNKVSHAGNTKLISVGMLVNGAYQVGKKTEIFWTGALNNRATFFRGSYRFPKNIRQVNTDLFPDGFSGISKPIIWSFSTITGIKGETEKGLYWNYSSAYGNNKERYYAENTNNASQYSMSKNAPTAFYTGTLIYQQLTNTINFAKGFSGKTQGTKLLNMGFGAEWRLENFQMKAGEEASWENYDPFNIRQRGSQSGLVIPPENAVNENRTEAGTYVDLEAEFNERFLMDLAGRYEYYSDFGGNLAGKLALRYKFSDHFSLRGSVNNGYRAPSLQQRFFGLITKGVSPQSSITLRRGIFNNEHKVTKAFGIPTLQAERSLNVNGGLTSTLTRNIYLTVDAYWIQIKDRVVLSGNFDRTIPEVVEILRDYPDIDQVSFFTNAINTRTRGIDAVLNGNWILRNAKLNVMLAANFTKTTLFGEIKTTDKLSPTSEIQYRLFNIEDRGRVEKGQPADKVILSMHYKTSKFGLLFRNTRFGKTAIVFNGQDRSRDEFFSPKILTDISFTYTLKKWLTIATGANNIFDVYPDRLKNYENTAEGIFIYSLEASQFGFNGGYYFVNMAFNF